MSSLLIFLRSLYSGLEGGLFRVASLFRRDRVSPSVTELLTPASDMVLRRARPRVLRFVVPTILLLVGLNVGVVSLASSLGLPLLRPVPEAAPPPPLPPVPPPPVLPAVLAASPAVGVLNGVMTAAPGAVSGFSPEAAVEQVVASPYQYACSDKISAAQSPLLGRSQVFRSGARGVVVKVWAYGAGQGPAALDALRSGLESCRGRDGVDPGVSSSQYGEEAFVASSLAFTDGSAWVVARRGDVLLSVSASDLGGEVPLASAQLVMSRLDPVLASLLTACLVPDASVSDAARNPYGMVTYSPFVSVEKVSVPDLPPLETPTVPELVVAFPDYDALTPTLALQVVPGQSPRLGVDPSLIVRPEPFVSERPREPRRPGDPVLTAEVGVPRADVAGPGCGWEFTGQVPPVFDEAALDAQARVLLAARTKELVVARDALVPERERWVVDYTEFLVAERAFEVYQEYRGAVRDAERVVERARDDYQDYLAEEERRRLEAERLAEEERRRLEEETRPTPIVPVPTTPVPSPTGPTPKGPVPSPSPPTPVPTSPSPTTPSPTP